MGSVIRNLGSHFIVVSLSPGPSTLSLYLGLITLNLGLGLTTLGLNLGLGLITYNLVLGFISVFYYSELLLRSLIWIS